MPIAILHAFSGISGDMTLGALVSVGLDPNWLRALPERLGLDGVSTEIRDVARAGIACTKVDFQIPPQPHG
ncbi:MAG TPA: nickel insertion protein, partial [Methylomirabilota bacterium]|nr:nickel insertion protein [Methylomirabilota bacterium]